MCLDWEVKCCSAIQEILSILRPQSSLLCSEELGTGPYPAPDISRGCCASILHYKKI
jgi:hypothetical protein